MIGIDTTVIGLVIAAVVVIWVATRAVRVIPEYERAVIFRLGRIQEPKGPGIAAMPPFAMGKRVSITRCPVTIGSPGAIFSAVGRRRRTGHRCSMGTSTKVPSSFRTFAIGSTMVASPVWIHSTVPDNLGGIMIFCSTAGVSCTVPSTSPPISLSPIFATGTNSHFFSRSSFGTSMPLGIRSPASA